MSQRISRVTHKPSTVTSAQTSFCWLRPPVEFCPQVAPHESMYGWHVETVLDPSSMRLLDPSQLDDFGSREIQILANHFASARRGRDGRTITAPVDEDTLKSEYQCAKKQILVSFMDKWAQLSVTKRCIMVWLEVHKMIGKDIPNLMFVVTSILTAQPHAVDNERLHGVRKLVENEKRQSMRHSTTDMLLRIFMNSPALFTDEAERWYHEVMRQMRGAAVQSG